MPENMSFVELMKKRRSIRKYTEAPIDRATILECLEAARFAPSAENVQPWRFVVVDDPALKKELCDGAFTGLYSPTKWAARAAVIVVVLARLDIKANRIGAWLQKIPFYLLDIGGAVEHFLLRAMDFDIGTCWIGWFNVDHVRKTLKVPGKYHIVSLISMGHIEERPRNDTQRHPIEEIAWFNEVK